MATNDKNGSDEVVEGSWSPRRSKATSAKATSAKEGPEQEAAAKPAKATKATKGDKSTDPEVLAGEIEKTREELAETLDEIAERVSPRRVADRTKKKVGDAVKEGTHDAVESVKGGVAAVKDKVGGDTKSTVEAPAATTGALADAAVTPVEPAGAEAPIYTSTLPPAAPSRLPALAGAGAALLVLLFVLRRRRRR